MTANASSDVRAQGDPSPQAAGKQGAKKEKPKSLFQLLKPYTQEKFLFAKLVVVLGTLNSLLAITTIIFIWFTILSVLDVNNGIQPNHSPWFWVVLALLSAILNVVAYVGALACSHIFAFNAEKNIRFMTAARVVRKPISFFMTHDSGAVRKDVDTNAAQTHTFIAHQFPDLVSALSLPIFLVLFIFYIDWKLALIVVASFLIAMVLLGSSMVGSNKDEIKRYYDAQGRVNSEAVEYVRGIPVVKTFGQSVHSFTNYKKAIDDYNKYVMGYTMRFRFFYVATTVLVSSIGFFLSFYAALKLGWLGADEVASREFMRHFILFAMLCPIFSTMTFRIASLGQWMEVARQSVESIEELLSFKDMKDVASSLKRWNPSSSGTSASPIHHAPTG